MLTRKTDKQFKQEVYDLVGCEYTFLEEYNGAINKILIRHNCNKCNNYEYKVTPNSFLSKKARCPKCNNRYTPTQKEFENMICKATNNEIIVIGEFKAMGKKIKVKHNINNCNHEWLVMPHCIISENNGCPKCKGKKLNKAFALSFHTVKSNIEKIEGYELLSDTYINAQTSIEVSCNKKHIFKTTYNRFNKSKSCPICSVAAQKQRRKNKAETKLLTSLQEDNNKFIEWCDLKYKNRNSYFIYECCKGHTVKRSVLVYNQYRGCPECSNDKVSQLFKGSGSYNWKGGITSISHHLRNCLNNWKKDSMRNSNYKCIITGDRFDVIHHLYGFDSILKEIFIESNLEIKENVCDYSKFELNQLEEICLRLHEKYGYGVCLTNKVHELFHEKYGYGNNTPSQFEEFKKNYN